MELILKENVHGLGYKDDVVKVKDGYGRNFLIPTGKAVIASASAKKCLAEELKQRAHKLEKIKNDALELAEKLKAIEPIKIAAKVSATGSIYGSVNGLQISEELAKRGFEIDRKTIVLKDVKEVGAYLYEKLEGLKDKYDVVKDHRGVGLIQGLEFTVPVGPIVSKALLEQKLVLISAGSNIIRFVPPLIIEKSNVDEMVKRLEAVIKEM